MSNGSEERGLIMVLARKCICHFIELCGDDSQLFGAVHRNPGRLVAPGKVFDYVTNFKYRAKCNRSQPDHHDGCSNKKRSGYTEADPVADLVPSFGFLQGCVRLLNIDVDEAPQGGESIVESFAIRFHARLIRHRKIDIKKLFCVT